MMNLTRSRLLAFFCLLSYPIRMLSFCILHLGQHNIYVNQESIATSRRKIMRLLAQPNHYNAKKAVAVDTRDDVEALAKRSNESPVRPKQIREESITEAYEDFVGHKFHFEKDLLLDTSNRDIDEGHSVVESMANLIEDVDE